MEGWQVWDLALACAGQLRIAPSGLVLGFDYGAVLTMAAAHDLPAAVVAVLAPAIEATLVEVVSREQNTLGR
ncbi:DUF7697 family protein [Oleisolibacter albus]|uniref:DUF7697 family protein n=1 Tax=Oleisolibacter albus TaxID=2171757 RepID=UPI003B832B86